MQELQGELAAARARIAELERGGVQSQAPGSATADSEARFRAQYKGLPIPVYSWQRSGADFVLVDYNDAADRITRGTVARLVGARASDLYHDEPDILAEMGQCYAERRSFRREMLYRLRVLGEQKYLAVSYGFVPPDLVLVHTEDVTERRQAEEALQRERDLTAAVLNTVGALVVVLDPEGRIVRFNRACEVTTGYTFDKVAGKCFWDIVLLPEETEAVQSVFRELAAGQFPNRHENFWVTKAGDRRLLAWSNTALTDHLGRVEYVVGTGIDITEQRAAEEQLREAYDDLEQRVAERTAELSRLNQALRESEERFRRAFEHAAFGMALVGGHGRLLQVNPSLCRILGYTAEELRSRSFHELTHPDDVLVGVELFQDLMAGRRDYGWQEKRCVRKDGRVIWALLSTAVVRSSEGVPSYLVSQIEDITERKEAVANLVEKEEQYRSIFEATRDGLIINDLDGITIEANPAFCAMHGTTRQKVVGLPPTRFIRPQDHGVFADYMRTGRTGEPFHGHAMDVREDGTAFHVEVNAAPFTYRGKPHVLGVVRDVTDQVLAQQMLEERVAARTRELSALYDVTAVASASLELETVLERSLDRVLEVMGCSVGGIHMLGHDGEGLECVAWRGAEPTVLTDADGRIRDGGPVGQVIECAEPVLLVDLDPGRAGAQGARAYVGAPLRAKGQVLGALSVIGEPGQQFNAEEVALLASIADQVGVAVDNARLYQQAEQVAVLEERERLARELHDSVTQALYSAALLAETGRRRAHAGDWAEAERHLRRLGEIVQAALREMRLLVYELRPPAVGRERLVGALQKRLDAVEGRAGIEARLLVEGEVQLPSAVEEELYRVAAEALNNALKHAQASSVTVSIHADERQLRLQVLDDGCGFDLEAARGSGGMGLMTMQQRAARIGAALSIRSAPGQGTAVLVIVRLDSQERSP